VADDFVKSTKALDAVVERAREALNGITMDTRAANPDGTTRFTRPRPGAARMYPETDVQIVKITPEYLRTLEKNLPEMPEDKLARFQKVYGLNEKLARQITDSEFITLFEELAEIHRELRTLMAVTLTEDLKKLQRDGVNVDALTDDILKYIFEAIVKDAIVKESISEVITWLSKNPEKTVESAIEELKLNLMNEKDLEKFIDEKILSNRVLISKLGKKASGPLMGIVMRDLRGRAKASDVQRIINKKLNN
jgi:glutamyl-tRNA(Gln) amidotransferase subunit E